jgi:hypothetical protein
MSLTCHWHFHEKPASFIDFDHSHRSRQGVRT